MFPIPFNFPFRKKDGSVTSIGAAIETGGSYDLPTASGNTKGGVKIGNRLTMTGEVLSADLQLPTHDIEDAGKVLTVADDGSLEWDENGGAGVEILTKTEWDELTTAEKQAKGLVIIQTSTTGFLLGEYVNGAEFIELIHIEQTYLGEGSFTADYYGDKVILTFDNVITVGGAIFSLNPSLTDEQHSVRFNTTANVQCGTCSKSATLPTVITQGSGRIAYGSGSTPFTVSKSTMNCFIGQTTNSTLSYSVEITID